MERREGKTVRSNLDMTYIGARGLWGAGASHPPRLEAHQILISYLEYILAGPCDSTAAKHSSTLFAQGPGTGPETPLDQSWSCRGQFPSSKSLFLVLDLRRGFRVVSWYVVPTGSLGRATGRNRHQLTAGYATALYSPVAIRDKCPMPWHPRLELI
jgi:hypothetical protein